MKNQVIFTMGGKGGVGKTAFMVNLAEYFKYNQIPVILLDCDMENKMKGSFSHYFPEAQKVDIRQPDGLDIFIDSTQSGDNAIVLADLGAGSGFDLIQWFTEMYQAAKNLDIVFTAVGTITANPGSLETVFSWANYLQYNVQYLITLNNFQGEPKLWSTSKSAEKFRNAFSPCEILFKARIPEWQTELENYGYTLTQAMESDHPKFKKLSARCRLELWRNQIFEELEKCNTLWS